MPLYEYECENKHRFEVIRKFSDPPLEACPTCGAPVRKLFSSPAIQFKGSGWYITDYAKKDSTAAGKTGDSKESTGSDKTSGGADKPAATPASSDSGAAKSETAAAKPAASTSPGKSD
jgi:putative FmdB family regulatory protein